MFKKILSFFTMFVLAFTLTACGGGSPEKVAENFYVAMFKGDIDTVISSIYIPASEKTPGTEEMMKGELMMMIGEVKKQADAQGGVKKVISEKARYNSDKTNAAVNVTVVFKNKKQASEDVKLVKDEKKQWKVKL